MVKTQENILNLIGNGSQLRLENTEKYAAILGESPSKGAKSPTLWNKAFNAFKMSVCMHPMDVAPDRLKEIVMTLRNDSRYIGGAVTMPYKMAILPLLDKVENEAVAIGAVNCIYREGEKLVGANTDGAGALESLKAAMGANSSLAGKTVVILGIGGAGSAVAVYMAGAVGATGKLYLTNRTRNSAMNLAERLKDRTSVEVRDLPLDPKVLAEADVIINCTAVGFENLRQDDKGAYTLRPYTPLGPVDSSIRVPSGPDAARDYMATAGKSIEINWTASLSNLEQLRHAFLFDIVYQPRTTLFLSMGASLGFATLNGAAMNLEQAVIAFHKTARASNLSGGNPADIRRHMMEVW